MRRGDGVVCEVLFQRQATPNLPKQAKACLVETRLPFAGTAVKIELDVTLKPLKCSRWVRQQSESFGDDYYDDIPVHRRKVSSRTLTCLSTWCSSCRTPTGQRWLQRQVLPVASMSHYSRCGCKCPAITLCRCKSRVMSVTASGRWTDACAGKLCLTEGVGAVGGLRLASMLPAENCGTCDG
jgi:hypothetical protein